MTQLSKESLPAEISKFVRDGLRIEFDDPSFAHAIIAKEAGLGEPTGGYILGLEFRKVDDAGEVEKRDGVLYFSGTSSSCELRGDPTSARDQTVEVASALTGKPEKAE